eukprot:CAMPEP_0195026762 /NCGR_PEP_ID=MMETSP0326_2-20130528/50963_1 /TAXON_ID=2866 ORGANISM="Crypthecodinium cohnii, Strain Seligo" /NCGR_SAMPLE_ID=MMETSP0326_2 /ASSEMBLY_ACC=CAM_ASM_000348 /LENGTH=166 /DNA_ID=CAMNT_0040048739 /DNA_START=122 /DNA_END=620 /DNA_ORIENTATION=-
MRRDRLGRNLSARVSAGQSRVEEDAEPLVVPSFLLFCSSSPSVSLFSLVLWKREWPHSSLFLLLVLAVWSSHSSSRLQGPDDRGGRSFAELEVRPGSCGRTKAARASCSLLHDFRAPDDRPARVLLGHQEASKVACGPFLEQPELSPEAALAEDRRDEVVGPTGEM